QAEDGIRYFHVTGVQTCALPISTCHSTFAGSLIFKAGRNSVGRRARCGCCVVVMAVSADRCGRPSMTRWVHRSRENPVPRHAARAAAGGFSWLPCGGHSSSQENVWNISFARPETWAQSSALLLLTSITAVCGRFGEGIQALRLREVTVTGPAGVSCRDEWAVSTRTAC